MRSLLAGFIARIMNYTMNNNVDSEKPCLYFRCTEFDGWYRCFDIKKGVQVYTNILCKYVQTCLRSSFRICASVRLVSSHSY